VILLDWKTLKKTVILRFEIITKKWNEILRNFWRFQETKEEEFLQWTIEIKREYKKMWYKYWSFRHTEKKIFLFFLKHCKKFFMPNAFKTYTCLIHTFEWQTRVFFKVRQLHPVIIFVGKACRLPVHNPIDTTLNVF